MDAKIVAVLALVLAALCLGDGECARGGGRAGTWLCGAAILLVRAARSDPNASR